MSLLYFLLLYDDATVFAGFLPIKEQYITFIVDCAGIKDDHWIS